MEKYSSITWMKREQLILQGAISYGSEIGLLGTISIKDTNWKGKGQELGLHLKNQMRIIQVSLLISMTHG